MKKPCRLLFFFCCLTIFACGNDKKADSSLQNKDTRPINQDSIRLAYKILLQKQPKLLPAKQVKTVGKLYPVDEAQTDTGFYVFRETLLQILEAKNEFKLLEMVDDSIQNGFGGDPGIAYFVESWKLDVNKDSSAIWQILKHILRNGGVFDPTRDNFVAPYYVATFPDGYDLHKTGVITGEGVRVRAGTDVNSEILKTISYDILPILSWKEKMDTIDGEEYSWVKVRYEANKEGYIYGKYIWSPLDYSAVFTRQPNGSWLLTSFGTGD